MYDLNTNALISEFQRVIYEYRMRKSMSYADIAGKLKISSQMLMKYEKEDNINIPTNKLFKILRILEVPRDEIIRIIKIYY